MLRFKNFSDPQLDENISSSHVPVNEMPPPVLTLKRVGITTRSSKGPKTIVLYQCDQIRQYFTVLVD